jgi:hypothetical protein
MHADHHQQADLVLLQADLEVDPVDPQVHVVGVGQGRLLNAVASSCQSLVNLVIVAAESPWLVPRNWVNAGAKSEDDRPCRYSSGSTSATRGDFLAHAGRIAPSRGGRSWADGAWPAVAFGGIDPMVARSSFCSEAKWDGFLVTLRGRS